MNRMSRCQITILFVPLFTAALPAVEGAALSRQAATQAPQQAVDEEYTARILEYTTEKFFLTDLVDHLPASERVPSPEKILGYVIGAPEKLTYTRDINRYMRELAKASPRVRVYSIGLSDEGRQVHVAAETIKTKDGDFSAGNYVVRMDQPYSRIADMLLDTRYFNPSDPTPYDDTGWTLGPLKNVKTIRVKDTAILQGAMNLLV